MEKEEIKPFEFYTEEELLDLKDSLKLAQARTNKMMQISRLTHTIKIIVSKMGFQNESQIEKVELRGDCFDNPSLYDAYLLASYERKATRIKLSQMPNIPKIVQMIHLFFYEVQKEDPVFWKEMKERAGARAAQINQAYKESLEIIDRQEREND